jgi:hypothetical protein
MTKRWRDVLRIHPAAELFPLMTPDELHTLGEDIKKNGLTSPIVLWRPHPQAPVQLLDGRNRLDAIEIATGSPAEVGAPSIAAGAFLACNKVSVLEKPVDPFAYVISANIHRRHLSAEQKREMIAKLIRADPSKSDRQIADTAKVSPTTVGTVRAKMEATGDVSKLDRRRDRKGRQQPVKKGTTAKSPRGKTTEAQETKAARSLDKPKPRDGIGPNSSNEAARLRARNEELERENGRLERENLALRSEVDELRAELAKRAPVDDGLDIPPSLRRGPAP